MGYKKTEWTLLSPEQKYQPLFNQVQDAVFIVSIDGIILDVNTHVTNILGYASEDLIDSPIWNIIELDEHQDSIEVKDALLADQTIPLHERTLCRKDGSPISVELDVTLVRDSQGQPHHFQATVRDISKRKKIEKDLRDSEEKFRITFQAIRDSARVWERKPDGRILLSMVNKSVIELIGTDIVGLLGEELENIFRDYPDVIEFVQHTMDTGKPLRMERSIIVPTTGEEKWFIWDFTKPADNLVLVITKDITDHKHVEVLLSRQRDELIEFAHAMSHDVRNGLHTILSLVALLEKISDKSYVVMIGEIVARLERLLTRSLTLAEAGLVVGETTIVDLNELISSVAASLIPDDIEFVQGSLPTIVCDRDKTIQVIQNLLINAVEHGCPSRVEVSAEVEEEGVALLFINDGFLISPEHHDRIFNREFSTKEMGGFGLTIVRKIVEAQGWNIYLDKGSKTTFRIIIPRSHLIH